jgi:acyl-CoA thioesterase FadM
MKEERIEIQKLLGYHCFACGTENPIGLNMQFYRLGETICSEITLGRQYEGWENLAHGGIISALLDEVMSWTILYFKRVLFVTRKMEVKYLRPILIGTPVTIVGRLMDGSEPPKIKARAEIRDNDGNVLTKGTGEFVVLDKDRLSFVPDGLKEDMLSLFERFDEPQNV